MLEILQFYVSGFWVWLGITVGMALLGKILIALVLGAIGAVRGADVTISD